MSTRNTPDLPAPLRAFVDATNNADTEAFLDAFTDDAFLDDWGRQFHGRDGIASWNSTDNIGVRAHFDVQDLREGDVEGRYELVASVRSNRFNGTGTFTVDLRDGRISRFVIS